MRLWQRVESRQVQRFYGDSDDKFAAPRPDPSQPAGTDLIPEIKHIVLLMKENHSFDNYLGTLGHGEGLPLDAQGVPLPLTIDGKPVPFHRDGTTTQLERSPVQSWHACHLQYADGTNLGFLDSVQKTVPNATDAEVHAPMRYWTEADLPFYAQLAREFTLLDHWFCSCLGPTFPNRRFLVAGTAHGLIDDLPFGLVDRPEAGTIFDLLTRNGIDWIDYHSTSPQLALIRRLLGRTVLTALRRSLGALGRWIPMLLARALGHIEFTADVYPLSLASAICHLRHVDQFVVDAQEGRLPPVCIVDPDYGRTSEENPQDIADGEAFSKKIIDAVRNGPGWDGTLLIWFYDEHGGYYDHVPPPPAVPPDDVLGHSLLNFPRPVEWLFSRLLPSQFAYLQSIDGGSDRAYDRLGFRVPAVIVSPLAKPGAVISDTFDHTSALRLIEEKFNLPALTRRDAAANSLLTAVNLTQPGSRTRSGE
jgi:phospholipase C